MGQINDRTFYMEYKDKDIRFKGSGGIQPGAATMSDHFSNEASGVVSSGVGSKWTSAADTGCTVATYTPSVGSIARLTTDATDNDRVDMGGAVAWLPSAGPISFEARVKCDVVTTLGLNVGLSDAATEASQTQAVALSTITYTATATEGVYWVFDIDATTDVWYGVGSKAGAAVPLTNATSPVGTAPVAATYETLRIDLDAAYTASFYQNDVYKGSIPLATTGTTLLCPYISVKNQGAAAHVLDVDYVWIKQDLV